VKGLKGTFDYPVHGPPKQFLNTTEDGEILDGVTVIFQLHSTFDYPVHGPPKQFLNTTEDGEILDGGDGDHSPSQNL
jgi:hypothetical protein